MTEEEWLACVNNLGAMYAHVEGRVSDRKLRLASCGYLRLASHLLSEEKDRLAVEAAERFADGQASLDELRASRGDFVEAHFTDWPRGEVVARATRHAAVATTTEGARSTGAACYYGCLASGNLAARLAPTDAAREAAWEEAWRFNDELEGFGRAVDMLWDPAYVEARGAHLRGCCDVLRDVVGNPFRPSALDPSWLAWKGGTIPTLARAIYDGRALPSGLLDPVRLALLADALEDAGCTDPDILGHLRDPGPHVRGCWVVDLLLGKA